ncbi:unnamed protein product [Closterium sp. NIES-53]
MHADPEHRWDISAMTVKEALASLKGKAVKAAMEEEIHTRHEERLPARASSTGALNSVLLGAGWKKSQVNTALYFKVGVDKVTCWVLVYVDNLLAASSSAAMLKELKELLEAAFELRENSPVQKYLGLEIVRDRSVRKLWLHQQGYADKLRRRFLDEEQNGHTPKTPVSVDANATLTLDDEEAQERHEEEYWQKVGSLQFAATTTRPDIAFACSKLGSGLTVRSDHHWREVDRCLAYLANTHDTALEFGGGAQSLKLVGYVDADDAGDKQNRTSTGGYVFVFGGAAVSWSSQCIKCATLSSTESEYMAATEAGKVGRRLRFLLAEFRQLDAGTPTVLRVDNKSAITVAEGMGLTVNLKHMERQQAWLQHMVKRGKFSLRYIPTAEQPADFLTKALHYPAFKWCSVAIDKVRLVDVGDSDNNVQHVNAVESEKRSRPATVSELVDEPGRPAQGPRQGRQLWEGTNFGWSTWEVWDCTDPLAPGAVLAPPAPVVVPFVPAVPTAMLAANVPAAQIPAGGSSPQEVSATTGGPGPGESGGPAVPGLPASSAAAPPTQRPPSPGNWQHWPHSLVPRDKQERSRQRHDSPRCRGSQAYDWSVSMADLQCVVSAAVREEQNGTAGQSNSPRDPPTHVSPPPVAAPPLATPLPRTEVPPHLAPAASAAAPGNRMRLPWIPPVVGIEFVTMARGPVTAQYPSLLPVGCATPAAAPPVQTLVGHLPSGEVPKAPLGQLWRLSEGLRAVHLIQVYWHAALSQGVSLDGGPWDECLDAADRLAEHLAPVLAVPAWGGVAGVGQLGTALRGLRRDCSQPDRRNHCGGARA